MEYPYLKKLIAVFLVLASVLSSGIYIFSYISSSRPQNDSQPYTATAGQNAFVENLPESSPVAASAASYGHGNDPTNLTLSFAKEFSQEIIARNPQGPRTDTANKGGFILSAPTDDYVYKLLETTLASSSKSLVIDEKVPESAVKIASTYTKDDVLNYLSSFSKAVGEVASSTELSKSVQNPGPELAGIAARVYGKSYTDLLALTAPKPLEPVHRNLLKILADQRKYFEISADYQNDPLKAVVAVQSNAGALKRDYLKFKNDVVAMKESGGLSGLVPESGLVSMVNSIIGLNKAYALDLPANILSTIGGNVAGSIGKALVTGGCSLFGPLGTILSDIVQKITDTIKGFLENLLPNLISDLLNGTKDKVVTSLLPLYVPVNVVGDSSAASLQRNGSLQTIVSQTECQWIYKTIVEILKNYIINQMQNDIVAWIQGDGSAPRFITNWKSFLSDAANAAVGNTIYQIAPFLCSNLGPLVQVALKPVPQIQIPIKCTLDQVIGDVTGFYNSFSNGGWIAYGYSLQPQNNLWGSLIIADDIATREKAAEQEAAQNKGLAGQGFTGHEVCVKSHLEPLPDGQAGPPNEVCDKSETLTPGSVMSHALAQTLNWGPQQVIQGDRLDQMISAIVQALINRVITEGIKLVK